MQVAKPPCSGKSAEQIEASLRANVQIGAAVAVRNMQEGLLHYVPAQVVRLGRGRFEVQPEKTYGMSTGSNTFYYSGKNCWCPKGQTHLVIPTPEVTAAYGSPGSLGVLYGPFSI